MSYTKTTWQNDQAPAINATNLNKIETGIFNNDAKIYEVVNTLGVGTATWDSSETYAEGDVVIYANKLYKNITGNYTITNPAEDTTNWMEISLLSYINSFQPVVLYTNNSGTLGNIEVSDSVYNYSYFKIFGIDKDDNTKTMMFEGFISGTKLVSSYFDINANGAFWATSYYNISGTGTNVGKTLTFNNQYCTTISHGYDSFNYQNLMIKKIVGYR